MAIIKHTHSTTWKVSGLIDISSVMIEILLGERTKFSEAGRRVVLLCKVPRLLLPYLYCSSTERPYSGSGPIGLGAVPAPKRLPCK